MAIVARSGTTIRGLGLAIFGGAIISSGFVVVEYQIKLANQRHHDQESLLFQLMTTNDLIGIDLAGRDLSGTYLPGKNLVAARLSRTRLVGAKLYFADLRHASMRSVDASGCDLRGSVPDEADNTNGALVGVDLYESDLLKTCHRDADLNRASITNVDLSGADCVRARLVDTVVTNRSVVGTDFRDADLPDVTLERIEHDSTTWLDGFSPSRSVTVESDWIEGTTLADWLTLRRSESESRMH